MHVSPYPTSSLSHPSSVHEKPQNFCFAISCLRLDVDQRLEIGLDAAIGRGIVAAVACGALEGMSVLDVDLGGSRRGLTSFKLHMLFRHFCTKAGLCH
jgi:hypothetical protein